MPYNPYGVSGSIVHAPRKILKNTRFTSVAKGKRFGSVTIRDTNGNILAVVDASPAVKLARKLGVKSPKVATAKPLTELELRSIALAERKEQFSKSLTNIHALAN